MALDERRGPFSPTLWYIPYGRKEEQDAAEVKEEETDSEKLYNAAVDAEKQVVAKLIAKKEKPDSLSEEDQQKLGC